jgi:predicted ATP-grasp superfamily ATP-dependent carboligase
MGLGHPRQTAFVRSLAKTGVPVHALHIENNFYVSSRKLTRFHHIDNDPEQQLHTLENIGRELGRAILFPLNDDYVALVSRHRDRLSKYFIVTVPDWEIVKTVFDRQACYAKAASVGIKIPPHWVPESAAEMQQVVAALEIEKSDYIIKTRSILSAPANETATRLTKPAPKNRGDLEAACEDLKRRTGVYPMIQQVVPGGADAAIGVTMLISPQGEIVMTYCVRRLRLASYKIDAGYVHPYELGSVVWCETTHDDEAADAAREVVRTFGYTGQLTVEFRRDSRNGELYLMKLEPRSVRAASLSTAIGMDIPTNLYKLFTGEAVNVPAEYPDGVGWLWVLAYGQSMYYNAHYNRRDILRVLRGSRRIKAFGEDFTDPLPLLRWALGRTARPVLGGLRKVFPARTEAKASA